MLGDRSRSRRLRKKLIDSEKNKELWKRPKEEESLRLDRRKRKKHSSFKRLQLKSQRISFRN